MTSAGKTMEIAASHDGLSIDDQTIDAWELDAARRALALIKGALGSEGMLTLVDAQRRASDEYFARTLQESNGDLRGAVNDFCITGLTLEEFLTWFRNSGADHATMVAWHPEHYVLGGERAEDGNLAAQQVMEWVGEHTPFIRLEWVDPSEFPSEFPDQDGGPDTVVLAGRGRLDNGAVVARALVQLKPTPDGDGFTLRVCSMFPAALPEAAFHTHVKHHAVEFRNAFRMAMAAKTA